MSPVLQRGEDNIQWFPGKLISKSLWLSAGFPITQRTRMDLHLMHGACTAGDTERHLFYPDRYRQPHTLLFGCLKTHKSMKKGFYSQSHRTQQQQQGPTVTAEQTPREAAQAGKCDLLVLRLPEGWASFTVWALSQDKCAHAHTRARTHLWVLYTTHSKCCVSDTGTHHSQAS